MAQVTIRGILADGHYYTCDYAIRNNWFINAYQKLDMSVFVIMHPECDEFIFVFIEEQKTYTLARMVTFTHTNEESKEQYYRKFQCLKEKLNNRKRK